jgi:acetylornithine aminotransferase
MKIDSPIMNTYKQLPIQFEKGHGCWLQDKGSVPYLDTSAGLAVTSLGHNHPKINAAVYAQAKKLFHVSNQYYIEQQYQLAERLCEMSGLDQAFFCNSGAEANESAIKLARLYARTQGVSNPVIITMQYGFHGRTMGNISQALHNLNTYQFAPLLPGFISLPFNDLSILKICLENNPEVIAVMLEPIQGEAGVIVPSNDYLKEVRKLCDKHRALMILDEVQTGLGRTGEYFAFQHDSIEPDIMTLAKGLANGLPIGVCLAQKEVSRLFEPGLHGSTFGGNPLCCAVGLAVCNVIGQSAFLKHVRETGNYLLAQLKREFGLVKEVIDIRGQGLMIALECQFDCTLLPERALTHGILINVVQQRIIRLTPPLIITKEQCDFLVEKLSNTLQPLIRNRLKEKETLIEAF